MPTISKKQQAKMQRARKRAMKKNQRVAKKYARILKDVPLAYPASFFNDPPRYAMQPFPGASPHPRMVYANRVPGTVYDADREGWVVRGTESGDDWDDEVDAPTDWDVQAINIASRLGRKRPYRPDSDCDDTRAVIRIIADGARGVSQSINCGHQAGMIAVQATQLLRNGKCARATKHIKTAFKFCRRHRY